MVTVRAKDCFRDLAEKIPQNLLVNENNLEVTHAFLQHLDDEQIEKLSSIAEKKNAPFHLLFFSISAENEKNKRAARIIDHSFDFDEVKRIKFRELTISLLDDDDSLPTEYVSVVLIV